MSSRAEGEEGFFGRWARRKEAALRDAPEAAAEVAPEPAPAAAAAAAAEEDERSDEEILAALGLKNPDEIGLGDDVRGFMAEAVPERLRRRALRSLWRSNPTLANLDELLDYGGDFTDRATVVENLATAYQVGSGMARRVRETVESLAGDGPGEGAVDDSGELDCTPALSSSPEAQTVSSLADAPAKAETGPEPEISTARLRMVFTFDAE